MVVLAARHLTTTAAFSASAGTTFRAMAELRPTPPGKSKYPSWDEVQGWVGWRVDDINGSMIGRVAEIIRDEGGAPAWLVVGEFRLGEGRRFVIPVGDAVGGSGRVWSPHPREQIRESARLGGPFLAPQAYRRLRAHYGRARRVA